MPLRHSVLGSAATDSLFIPHTRLVFGERAFLGAAPKAWNQLPRNICYFLLICFITVCTGQLLLYST